MRESPVTVISGLGGVATAATVTSICGRSAVRAAVASGDLVRARRGVYVLEGADEARVAAAMAGGVVSHESAARLLGIAIAREPDRPIVTVPRHRHATSGPARLHWADVDADELIDGVTTPVLG